METSDSGSDGGLGTWWWAAMTLVVLVVLGLVWVLFAGRDSESAAPTGSTATPSAGVGSTPAQTPAASSKSEPATAQWPDAGCHGTPASPVPPAEALTDLTWEPVLTSALPSSNTVGPARVDGPVRTCYQHSPAGALMAAVNIQVAQYLPPDGAKALEAQVTAGAGRDEMLAALARSEGQPGNIAGYRIGACVPTRCNVELATSGQGLYAAAVVPLVWDSGDWKIDGSDAMPVGGLVAGIPQGFTPWGPTS